MGLHSLMARRFFLNSGSLTAARLFTSFSQLAILPILARFISVEEFGLVALAMVVVVFVQLFSDAGMSRSLIRQPTIIPAEWNGVFWLLVLVGIVLSGLTLMIAPFWAWYYEEPKLFNLTAVLAVVPLFLALNAVPTSRLERDDRWPLIALIRFGAALAGLVVALALALMGFGAWALVMQQVTIAVVQCLLAFYHSPFRPMSPRTRTSLRSHFNFARDSIAVSILQTAQRQVPVMMIGDFLGTKIVGLHAMAQRLLMQPHQAITAPVSQVVYVRMAEAQDSPAQLGQLYVGSVRLLALAIFPPMAVLAGAGGEIFAFVLSEPWREIEWIFALAVPGIVIEAATLMPLGIMLQAVGRTGLNLRMMTEMTVLRLLAIAAALPFGILGVSLAISLFMLAYLPRMWSYGRRAVPFDWRAAAMSMAVTGAISGLGWIAARVMMLQSSGWTTLGWTVLVMAVVWPIAVLAQWKPLRRDLKVFAS